MAEKTLIQVEVAQESVKRLSKEFDKLNKQQQDILVKVISTALIKAAGQTNSGLNSAGKYEFGLLAGSYEPKTNKVKINLEGAVESRVMYAPFIEFGTGSLVQIPSGWEDFASQFRGAGIRQVNISPTPAFVPAIEKNFEQMNKAIDKQFTDIFEK